MDEQILLVDDEEDIREVLDLSLTDMGYDVLTAENGEQALEIFKKNNPSIVLTDIKMPRMDGVELLRRVKEIDDDTEVILITGHGDMDLAIKSFKNEATDFITKPISDDILEVALKRATEKLTMRRQLREYTENLEKLVKEQSERLVEAERLAVIGQAVEGLSNAINEVAGDLEGGIRYFNEMPCFVSIHNRNGNLVAANQLYKERLGNRVGEKASDIYDLNENNSPVEDTLQTGKGQRKRLSVNGPNGEKLPVIVYTAPIRDNNGELILVLEFIFDIVEVQRLREKLKASEQRYQQLFDEVPCYISVQDRNFQVVNSNRMFKEDFGDRPGVFCYEIYKHRKTPCKDCPVKKTFEDGGRHHIETVVTAKSGEQYNVLVWTAPLYDENGEIDRVLEISTNITEIRQLQSHLTSLGLLLGSVSHGIKGLLTALDGGMYLVSSGLQKDDEKLIHEGWDVVELMVARIRKMVLDILYYAKERELNWQRKDVFSFAEDVARIVDDKMKKKDIEFIKKFDDSLGQFEIDPGVASSALVNFLENAADACELDTQKKKHRVEFQVTEENGDIVFKVSDNGLGMDQETKENLFTLFFSSKGAKGTGLGLFISNKIIQQHGGSIDVSSEPEKGTTFIIRLPKEQNSAN